MRRAFVLVALAIAAPACGGRVTDLPAHGEALIVVDTDLPVPQLAGRLRVDLYADDGTWFESRDIARADPHDWPASFSVYSDDDTKDKRVLVRVRAYPEGIVRDYRGERYDARPAWSEPHAATDVADLCAHAVDLPVGGRVTARRGGTLVTPLVPFRSTDPLTEPGTGACEGPSLAGSIAARVTIPARGRYRFAVADIVPYIAESTLFLRASCNDPSSQLACRSELTASALSSGHLPRFDATLDPGTYWLVTGGALADWPSDVTVEALPLDALLAPEGIPPESTPEPSESDPSKQQPRLVVAGLDVTPPSEPLPTAAVDRLVLVRLVPGVRGRVDVTLRAACAGAMAKLGTSPETCVDEGSLAMPVVESVLDPDMTHAGGSARVAPTPATCGATAPTSDVACVPGGAFLFGSRALFSQAELSQASTPERIAVMSPFWMDRHEVTVARMRDALARGFVVDPASLYDNPAIPITTTVDFNAYCSWSSTPFGREQYPINCVSWSLARAYCRWSGGDLPTEAQWEYAATAAGRPFKTAFPWGDTLPTCDDLIFARNAPASGGPSMCRPKYQGTVEDWGVAQVTAREDRDVTPNGVVDLGGNVAEWTRDGAESFSHPCWRAAGARDPSCVEDDAPLRVARGGSWSDNLVVAARRAFIAGALGGQGRATSKLVIPRQAQLGFRCVYEASR